MLPRSGMMYLAVHSSSGGPTMDASRGGTSGEQPAGDERPLVNIEGERVALGPLRRDLLATYQRWINDFYTLRTLGGSLRPKTMEQETAWYERAATGEGNVNFTSYERGSWKPI